MNRRSVGYALIAAIGSLLFGFNTSIISGALLFLKNEFCLSLFQEELVVSTLLAGAVFGAVLGGIIADRLGRKKTLFVTAFLFFVGTLTLTDANGFLTLLVGRFISGSAVGIASLSVPLYIAEISAAKNRGFMVSIAQLMITFGILLAFSIQYLFAEESEWRQMFGFGLVPISIQFLGLFFLCESPSWLMKKGKVESAKKIARKLGISVEHSETKYSSWRVLLQHRLRKPLLVGLTVSMIQQVSGINTIFYYAPKIFQMSEGHTAQAAIFATLIIGIVNAVATGISLWLVDFLGRRFLLILGLLGMALGLAVLGGSMYLDADDLALGAILVYVSFFAISLGPVAWLLNSEIYPVEVRGVAMGAASFVNWVSNYFVSLTFLSLVATFGAAMTFWFYMVICILALWFVIRNVPETKGKTLEQIQEFWQKG